LARSAADAFGKSLALPQAALGIEALEEVIGQ